MHRLFRWLVSSALVAGALAGSVGRPASAGTLSGTPSVLHVGQVTRQDVPSQPGSEADTVVEPDVAVSPVNANIAIAAAHDSRFPNGGAVDISVAWTSNAGATWQHAPVQGITTATGGPYDRASDPAVAFGADGTAYLSVLLIDIATCPSAVAVLRSTDGGQTWSAPSYAHRSTSCDYSDDKNWLVVDRSPASPHLGRLYQFWTPFRYSGPTYLSSPQAVRFSDDKGTTWSATHYVTAINHGSQNSQPMILADGTIVDTYYDYGVGGRAPDAAPGSAPENAHAAATMASGPMAAAGINSVGPIFASSSTDGGATWQQIGEVTNNGAGYAPGVRCCLFGADIDPVTQVMYVAWEGGGPGVTDPVLISSSRDGQLWSSPVRVSTGDVNGVQRVNVDVVARGGTVYVAYGTRTQLTVSGGVVQQQLSVSHDRGLTFDSPLSLGPISVLKYAARAGGYFPGDYIGEALAPGRLYMVWARSSQPAASSTSPYHQVIDGATLIP
ncbi:MAG: hypothetical protein QOK39_1047 [Acidimicrobiaceae bacterium]|jgi:hypothetical protein|nr:hypothetical protein [Acidimicrobiaceae bacterium]